MEETNKNNKISILDLQIYYDRNNGIEKVKNTFVYTKETDVKRYMMIRFVSVFEKYWNETYPN